MQSDERKEAVKESKKVLEFLKNKKNEVEFMTLVDEQSRYGSKLILSGGDYSLDHFTPNQIRDICYKINNIWYYHDKMHPCNLGWNNYEIGENFIAKELKEIFPNYLTLPADVKLVSTVSGDFFTDIYQPIEYGMYNYELNVQHYRRQTIFVVSAGAFVLIVLIAMLLIPLSICMMQVAGVITIILLVPCLLLLGIDTKVQLDYYNKFVNYLCKINKTMKVHLKARRSAK